MKRKWTDFAIDYEADVKNSFLTMHNRDLKVDEVIWFQLDMLDRNKPPGILVTEARVKNCEIKFCFQVGGLTTLENYLRKKKITKGEFVELLDRIIEVILKSSSYLLDGSSFLLREDFIYINPANNEVKLAYLPVHNPESISKSFKNLVLQLLIDIASIETSDNFVQKVLELIKAEPPNLRDFGAQLRTLAVDSCLKTGSGETLQTKSETEAACSYSDQFLAEAEIQAGQQFFGHLQQLTPTFESDAQRPSGRGGGSYLRTMALGILALASAAMAIATSTGFGFEQCRVLLAGVLTASEWVPVTGLLLFGTLGFGIFRYQKWCKANKHNLVETPDEMMSEKQPLGGSECRLHLKSQLFPDKESSEQQATGQLMPAQPALKQPMPDQLQRPDQQQWLNQQQWLDQQQWPNQDFGDETVLLQDSNLPYLKPLIGGEKVFLEEDTLVIGRNKEKCNLSLDNMRVGRVHAELKRNGRCFTLTDLDSVNGTYINGERLVSNKAYRLSENDVIGFADAEYRFYHGYMGLRLMQKDCHPAPDSRIALNVASGC